MASSEYPTASQTHVNAAPAGTPAADAISHCPDCGGTVSRLAPACPHCGRPAGATESGGPVPESGSGHNGPAIASVILGALWIFGLGSFFAIATGSAALKQLRTGQQSSGRGLAITGLVLGLLGAVPTMTYGVATLINFFLNGSAVINLVIALLAFTAPGAAYLTYRWLTQAPTAEPAWPTTS